MTVVVDFQYLVESYSEALKDEINDYYSLGYTILMRVSYDWVENNIKPEAISLIKKWLEDRDINYNDILVNFQTNLATEYWEFMGDIQIPNK